MDNVWVYRHDGSIQCTTALGESVEQARADLASIIGDDEIIAGEKRYMPMFDLCGAPTGAVNAFEITHHGWIILTTGFVGPRGFKKWPTELMQYKTDTTLGAVLAGGEVPFPFAAEQSDVPLSAVFRALTQPEAGNNNCHKELLGRPLRVYRIGEQLTGDWVPNRVNIGLNERSIIEDVWFG